jgi:hypothetical protein
MVKGQNRSILLLPAAETHGWTLENHRFSRMIAEYPQSIHHLKNDSWNRLQRSKL